MASLILAQAPAGTAPGAAVPAGRPASEGQGNRSGAPYPADRPEIQGAGRTGAAEATETHEGTVARGGHDDVGFPPFKSETYASQILWLALAFGALYLFVARVVTPRLGGLLEARATRIRADLDAASGARTRSEAAMAAYEAALAGARAKAGAIAAETRTASAAASDTRRKALEAELGGRLTEAERVIAERKASAMGSVREVAEEAAAALVERLTGRPAASAELAAAFDAPKTGA